MTARKPLTSRIPVWPICLVVIAGCAPAATQPDASTLPRPVQPAIEPGPSSPSADAAAARLVQMGREAVTVGSWERAQRAAREVLEDFPTAAGSGEALWILARASLELGDAEGAAWAAERYADLLPAADPRRAGAHLLGARAQVDRGAFEAGVRALLSIAPGAPPDVLADAGALADSAVQVLDTPALGRLLRDAPPGHPVRPTVLAEYALHRFLEGAVAEARERAREAVDTGARGRAAEVAQAVLAGRVDVFAPAAPVFGILLPRSGSPGLRRFGEMVHEGVQVALEDVSQGPAAPRLVIRDDGADPRQEPALVRELEAEGALGIVGPLMDDAVARAVEGRTGAVPIISPTARMVPDGAAGVYSLGNVDAGALAALAEHARRMGASTAAVLHPGDPAGNWEAAAFRRRFEELGGRVVRDVAYPRGETDFREPLASVSSAAPQVLLVAAPARDVQLLAPQISYYGLDELGIRILGTEGWGSEEVRRGVDERHTDGVVVAMPRMPPGHEAVRAHFVERYERLFQRSLRSRVPAMGYDTARLLLAAYGRGVRGADELRARLEAISGFPGVTGVLSVRDGRIVREHRLVRLEQGEMIPLEGTMEGGRP